MLWDGTNEFVLYIHWPVILCSGARSREMKLLLFGKDFLMT